jgi:hypothetical protein
MLYDMMKDYTEEGQAMLKAANYMEEHGHAKFAIVDENGHVCLLGALNMAVTGSVRGDSNQLSHICLDKIAAKLGLSTESYAMDAIDWNNAEERTKAEVVNILRATAEDCKVTA